MDVTHFVVPGKLTPDQETAIRCEVLGAPILGPADMFARMVKIVGSPVQSRADVQSVAWMTKASKGIPTVCRDVTVNVPYDRRNYDDLVFRSDMEALVTQIRKNERERCARRCEELTPTTDAANTSAHLNSTYWAMKRACAEIHALTDDEDHMMLNAAIQEGEPRGREIERADLYAVPFDVVQAVAELPDRTSPDGDPEMMRVTAKELLGIVRSAIDAAMNAENGNG
ncbi:hypothetical protein CFR73_12905 [Novacetimonas maltaceti]|uniref:Uncharacterized protein n=1 Tax=Novacetimonas maltaceti TaxID=1203393 RepID=A0A2S3W010_9PROT|nr:hypothetical protein [Novacetimonas maltaceti]POF62192.1 hypothetical protein KMAL_22060 [Novacetimonas maltaceti]PYD59223.1 hypothetical protein CFR73_12905 [Novacetimonas maltaceti]BCZ75936.1 hypothetical protein [Komagataeibacter phage phiKM1]